MKTIHHAPSDVRDYRIYFDDVGCYEVLAVGFVPRAPVDVVQMPDGGLTTVDNTRLLAARYTDTPVQTRVHAYDTPIHPARADDLVSRKGDVPSTWGEGVENRIGRQNATYRDRYPSGSDVTGWSGN